MNRRQFLGRSLAAALAGVAASVLPKRAQSEPKVSVRRVMTPDGPAFVGRVNVSREVYQDSAIDFCRHVERQVAKALARNIDDHFINGRTP